jgi:hypothetical protein
MSSGPIEILGVSELHPKYNQRSLRVEAGLKTPYYN